MIALRPAWRGTNPYTGMLADALVASGTDVRDVEEGPQSVWRPADVVVLHWPDEFFFRENWHKTFRGYRSLVTLWTARHVQRKKIIWFAHNLAPHNRADHHARVRLRQFLKLVGGVVFLSEASRELVLQAYPVLASRPSIVIAHGDYRPIEHTPASQPRAVTGRPVNLAFIGQLRRYKGPDVLATLVAGFDADAVHLTMAGMCRDEQLADELRAAAAGATNIALDFGFLENAAMEARVDAADVVILPYRQILNSGSALLALSRHRPVIAPRLGSLVELQAQVGADWLWLYNGNLTHETLQHALEWARLPRMGKAPDLSQHDWSTIAAKLSRFFHDLVQRS